MAIKFEFDHPEFVSLIDYDTIIVSFFETESWLKPKDDELSEVPENYTIDISIPPQTNDALPIEVKESVTQTSQMAILLNAFVSDYSLQIMFGQVEQL